MANKYDLKTWLHPSLVGLACHDILGNACLGGDTAETGKTRFLTYIRVNRLTEASSPQVSLTVVLGNATTSLPAASTVIATANAKLKIFFPTMGSSPIDMGMVQEIRGSIEHPIVSVAGDTYLGVCVLSAAIGSSVGVFAQYYDE